MPSLKKLNKDLEAEEAAAEKVMSNIRKLRINQVYWIEFIDLNSLIR